MNISPLDYSTPQEGFAPRQTFGHGPSGIDVLSKLTDVRIFQLKFYQMLLFDNFVNFPPNLLSTYSFSKVTIKGDKNSYGSVFSKYEVYEGTSQLLFTSRQESSNCSW